MITLSNGRKLLFLLASGMMGFDAKGPTIPHKILYYFLRGFNLFQENLFSIITKTITLRPIKGPKKIKPLRNGWWNNWGLDNPGINYFLKNNGQKIRNSNIIISITAQTLPELKIIIDKLNILAPDITAIEFNVSCPSYVLTDIDLIVNMCYFLADFSKFPLLLKIGWKNNYLKIAKKTEGAIEAIDINSVPEDNGAISGERAQFVNWRILQQLVDSTSTPVIGPSVWYYSDIERLFELGAKAISFGSISMIHPRRPWGPLLPTRYVRKYTSGK